MSRKRNTFSTALKHLKTDGIVEAAPVNSTMGIYSIVPGTLTRTKTIPGPTIPDESTIDWDIDGGSGGDTSGLFDSEGNSKLIAPPGDNSYILGPMSAMFYNYASYDWTMIGYIREADRRFVNLGYLYQNKAVGSEFSGKLSDWDGVNDFNSYGQLTLEQALWFRDTKKKDDAGNNPDNYNYRAFYPGPPSSTPDAFGRYLCCITGTPKATKDTTFTRTTADMDLQGSDNLAGILDRLIKGKKLSKQEEEWLEDNAAQKEVTNALKQQIKNPDRETANLLDKLGKAGETFARYLTNTLPDVIDNKYLGDKYVNSMIKKAEYRSDGTLLFGDNILGTTGKPRREGDNIIVPFNYDFNNNSKEFAKNKDNLNFLQKTLGRVVHAGLGPYSMDASPKLFGNIPIVGGAADLALGAVFSKAIETGKAFGGSKHKPGELKINVKQLEKDNSALYDRLFVDGLITVDDMNLKRNQNQSSGDGDQASVSLPDGTQVAGVNYDLMNWINKTYGGGASNWYKQSGGKIDGNPFIPKGSYIPKAQKGSKSKTQVAHYKPEGKVLSEDKKTRIMKSLKEPVVLPETKKKSYKVSPGKRNKTNFQGMDKLVTDVRSQKPFKRTQDIWSKEWQGYNSKLSQAKKNEVLEMIGDGKLAFNYMLTDSKKMNADQLDEFWGLNPDFYSYFFGGKKYKATRKEQVKGDYIVFLIDEDGNKSSMLQSELNIKLEEENQKEMLNEYNKILSEQEPNPFFKDPLMKKVAKRLKNEIEYEDKPAVKGYPNEPPPEIDPTTGMHPKYGKTYKYDKLDPVSAVVMRNAPTGNPEIDVNVEKASRKLKIKEQYSNWKSDWRKDLLDEGMTTQMLTGVLPSTGNTDLEVLQTGLDGEGDIDYGEGGLGDEVMAGEGEYTCFSNLDTLDNVVEPNNTGTHIRIFDQDSKEFRNQLHHGGAHGYLLAMPGYVAGMMRNVKPLGDYNAYDKSYRTNKGLPLTQNGSDLYYHIYGQTNDELGKGYGSWNSNDGLLDSGMGVVLNFDGPGSPRFVALKAIDSTEFDTIKIHAAVASNSMVSDYRDSDGVLRDKKVQVYYWAGDHKDYVKHSSASNIYDGNKNVSGDGWRPINMKPNGELDNTVDPYIIKHAADREMNGVDVNGVAYSASNKLHGYSVPLPEYTRSKNARYIIIQTDKNNNSDDNRFALASIRFQRKNTLRVPSISKPLTDIEAAPFIRVGQRVDQNAEQRKKKVQNMIKASLKYGNIKFGKGMYNSSNIGDE